MVDCLLPKSFRFARFLLFVLECIYLLLFQWYVVLVLLLSFLIPFLSFMLIHSFNLLCISFMYFI
jgi:hypothetical protein